MIDYINVRLGEWARWSVSDARYLRTTLGAHSCWPQMLGEAASTESKRGEVSFVPLNDIECCETDKAICALPATLKEAVVVYYKRTGTTSIQIAKRLGVSERTLFDRISQAHQRLLGILNDIAAGIAIHRNSWRSPEYQEARSARARALIAARQNARSKKKPLHSPQ
jgi:transposase-like protein